MKTPLTREQEDNICYIIGEWYLRRKGIDWNARIGRAKEELKDMICNSHRQDFPRAVDILKIEPPFFPPDLRYKAMQFALSAYCISVSDITPEEIDKCMEEQFGDYYVECRERAKK